AKAPQQSLGAEQAKQLAKEIGDEDRRAKCILDLMATGEAGFAKTYLLADRIQRHKPPSAPVLVFPEDFKTDLQPTVTFTWKRSASPEGGTISYRHYVWPVGERPDSNQAITVDPKSIQADSPT